jgi:hypothetical protein
MVPAHSTHLELYLQCDQKMVPDGLMRTVFIKWRGKIFQAVWFVFQDP